MASGASWIVGNDFRNTRGYHLAQENLALIDVRVTASGIPVGAATAPTAAPTGISFANGETALINFEIPKDYADNKDQLALKLQVIPSANAADTTDLGVTTAQTIWRDGEAAITTARTAVAEVATASTGQLAREVILDLANSGFRPGDVVQLTLDANGSGATELILVGLSLIYRAFHIR